MIKYNNGMFFKGKDYYKNGILKKLSNLPIILNKRKPVIIYGAARLGRIFLSQLKTHQIKVAGFIDKNTRLQKNKIDGIPVYSLKQARNKFLLNPIIVGSVLYENEIRKVLIKAKFKNIYTPYLLNIVMPKIFSVSEYRQVFKLFTSKKYQYQINKVYRLLSDKKSKDVYSNLINFRLTGDYKYLEKAKSKNRIFAEKDILPLSKKEIYVDCGAYNGDTVKSFIDVVNGNYKNIYAFEPDKLNFTKMKKWVNDNKIKLIHCYKKGVYSSIGKIQFQNKGTADSRISRLGRLTKLTTLTKDVRIALSYISMVNLDSFFEGRQKPTLIKMDIEGAEMEAIKGMKLLLKKYRPKLVISLYHQPRDYWEIILLLRSINKDYNFFVRHYTNEFADTICYAI